MKFPAACRAWNPSGRRLGAPIVTLFYFICYLDRVNIGFVTPLMNKDLGLSSYNFGLGAGAFFWGYRHWHRLGQLGRHLGGSVSPPIVGWLKDYTGNFTGGLYALAAFGVLAAIVAAPSREWLFTA